MRGEKIHSDREHRLNVVMDGAGNMGWITTKGVERKQGTGITKNKTNICNFIK